MDRPRRTQRTGAQAARIIRAMLLAIDIGNSNVTIGLVKAGSLVAVRRAMTPPRASADELELLLDGLLRLDDMSFADVSAIACASVVPSLAVGIEAIAERRERALVVAEAGTVPIAIRVDRPSEVGADRLVNALAAQRVYGTPAVIVDFGTATTFDCVAADGAYVGGAIAPGLELGLEALAARTAKLPESSSRSPTARSGGTRSGRCSPGRCTATSGWRTACSGGSGVSSARATPWTRAR